MLNHRSLTSAWSLIQTIDNLKERLDRGSYYEMHSERERIAKRLQGLGWERRSANLFARSGNYLNLEIVKR